MKNHKYRLIQEQMRWIEEHGSTLEGYIAHYHTRPINEATDIYNADILELKRRQGSLFAARSANLPQYAHEEYEAMILTPVKATIKNGKIIQITSPSTQDVQTALDIHVAQTNW